MTKEEILAMDPSVQMGNLVATEVMKWHRERDHWVTPEGFWIKGEGLDGWYPWRDISAAWQVVEHLCRKGFCVRTEVIPDDNRAAYYCSFYPSEIGGAQKMALTLGASMPEAICKAALMAKLATTETPRP